MRARVLIINLSYLKRVLSADYEKLSSQVFRVFAERDIKIGCIHVFGNSGIPATP